MNRSTVFVLFAAASLLATVGCEAMGTAAQSKTVQGGVLGSAVGAGTGAIIGNQTSHHAGTGAAIGAGLGALGGAMVGHGMEEQSAQSASSPAPATTGRMKFCPVGGELYPENVQYCPIHGAQLRYKE